MTDALEKAEKGRYAANARSAVGYNPPSDTVRTDCRSAGSNVNCTSTTDTSSRDSYDAGYALGSGIGNAIGNAVANRRINKEVKDVQAHYLSSRRIEPSQLVGGYFDFYVEDIRGGPFRLILPIGSRTYTLEFGPEGAEGVLTEQ
jgi:hypothetical protein